MAEYIGKYENAAAIQSAVDGGELIKPYVALDENTGMIDWNSKYYNPIEHYLTFEIKSDGVVGWKDEDGTIGKTIQYSKNGGKWTSLTSAYYNSIYPKINVVKGDILEFKGDNSNYSPDGFNRHTHFKTTCQFSVKGNIMSLVNSTNFSTLTTLSSANTFYLLFYDCTGLTDASKLILPATTLTNKCYQGMFMNCRSLTTVPSNMLPVTTLANACYKNMFLGCTSLTTAPELPATTLTNDCYNWMFYGCGKLNYVKCLATDISASNCTSDWLLGVASTGTFVKAAGVNWSTGNSGIPNNWTVVEE